MKPNLIPNLALQAIAQRYFPGDGGPASEPEYYNVHILELRGLIEAAYETGKSGFFKMTQPVDQEIRVLKKTTANPVIEGIARKHFPQIETLATLHNKCTGVWIYKK